MGQRDIDPLVPGDFGGPPREPHRRWFARDDLNLAQPKAAHPKRLDDRLLGSEPRRQVTPRPSPGCRVLTLGLGEDTLGEAGVARQGALETVDLELVDADAWHGAGYLPMPAISVAVASSPEEPEPIAR
jgi:hypothetical protein